MATQNFINECKNRANANRLGKFDLKAQLEPVTGKNLLDKHLGFQLGYINTSGTFVAQNQTALFNHNIEVEAGETYCFSTNQNIDNMVISMFDSNNVYKSRTKVTNVDRIVQLIPNNVAYVKFNINYNNSSTMTETIIDNLQVMVEKDNTRTEPYEDYPRDDIEINQSNYLKSIEFKDTCYVNNTIIGSTYTKSADIQVLDLPQDTQLIGQSISPQIGVKYANNTTEYITFDDYTIESSKDEQTASNTGFTGMNGGAILDKEYVCSLSFEEGATHTIYEFYQDACYQLGIMPTDISFDNGDLIMTGNPFQNHEPIRTVIEEVERVSCSIARFDWANQTVTLGWLSNQIDYEFNTSDYSILEGSMEQYGPLNVIILGNSQLDGENVTMTDSESVELNGEHQIMIDAPYFLYTEELRTQAIQAIYNKLDGLTYYDLKLTTPYGKPFLKVGDKIRINTNEGQTYDTYVLSHTFTYDGAFTSVIESPALTSEEQKVKNEKTGNSLKERMRRTEVIVDKTTGDITSITQQIEDIEDEFDNYYTVEQTNTLVQNAETGVTNTFSEAGGNNVFRNTGLWFGTQDTNNPYEYWNSTVERITEDKAANRSALRLKATTLYQEQNVPNGNYTVSFKYKKLINAAVCSVIINGETYPLNQTTDTEIVTGQGDIKAVIVSSQTIKVQFISDTDDACEIYDIMVNAGRVKLAYSQNQNETTTDTVNISKGITITSTLSPTTFKANADGIRIYANSDLVNEKTKFTDKGIETEEIEVKGKSEISGLLIQEIGSQTWLTKI